MNDLHNPSNRRFPRVTVGDECSIRFVASDLLYESLPVNDIGLGGCGVVVPTIATQPLQKDSCLEELILNHPKLPVRPLKGRVAFILGKHNPDPEARSIMGIEFLEVPPHYHRALERFVSDAMS